MKKLFYVLLSGITALGLISCLSAGANRQEGTFPAVVSYNIQEGLPSILTVIGEFAARDLLSSNLEKGDCILAHFTLDWDNQPEESSINYASNIAYVFVEQSKALMQNNFDEMELEDLLLIRSVGAQAYSPNLDGKFFFHFIHSAPQKQEMKYIAIVSPDSETTPGDTIDVRIIAQKTNYPDTPDMDIENLYAIDMHDVIRALGKEATYGDPPIEYPVKELKIRIKYCTSLNEDNTPVFTLYQYNGQSIITLSVYI